MGAETVYVDPAFVRIAGANLKDVGAEVANDAKSAKDLSPSKRAAGQWAALSATRTLGRLWRTYLSGMSDGVNGYGQRLGKVANAYEACDEEAAAALGIALPENGPVVKPRPGRVPA